ncbi:MAG: NmrA family NAD(P)-binding protein [Candidatus Caldatribacteriaceae bacterium]
MKILVIGGTGTIGSFVTREFWKNGYRITLLVRGLSRNVFPQESGVSIVHGDRKDRLFLREIAKKNLTLL